MEAKFNPILHNLHQIREQVEKRSDHPDFLTSAELKQKEWSGVRLNSITSDYEIWVRGEVKKVVNGMAVRRDPTVLANAHCEVFGIHKGS